MNLEKILGVLKGILAMLATSLKSPDSKVGVKETKEALAGLMVFAAVIGERLKDGVGLDDLAALWSTWQNDEAVQAALKLAVEGYSQIPAEVKDMDLGEGAEVLEVGVDHLPKLLAALKKEEPAPEAEAEAAPAEAAAEESAPVEESSES